MVKESWRERLWVRGLQRERDLWEFRVRERVFGVKRERLGIRGLEQERDHAL